MGLNAREKRKMFSVSERFTYLGGERFNLERLDDHIHNGAEKARADCSIIRMVGDICERSPDISQEI
ncbi:hypothetical protein [Novosphingobium sp.]|jgi:hypothetical protein|uniref:hypothetical protein n=1 Tax=Novosphingobium sp. TaxID=1874826 RepID=UPI002FE180DC